MEFNFETTIKETKNAVNTAAKIADILAKSEVTFSTVKGTDTPGIWAMLPGKDKKTWLASLDTGSHHDHMETSKQYGEWWTAYPKRRSDPYQSFLFDHLTDAATELVEEWIHALCDEYDRRLAADVRPEQA